MGERDAERGVLFRLLFYIKKHRKGALWAAGTAVFTGCLVLAAANLSVYEISGRSMESAFVAGDVVLVESLSYRFRSPRRFEVVVFRDPLEPGRLDLKRVVGLPGEVVEAREGRLFVDGRPVAPPPGVSFPNRFGKRTCGGGVFVLGDNHPMSTDSRTFGPVPEQALVGRVIARLRSGERGRR